MNCPVVFFDFDGTLTRSDSLIPFLRQVRGARFALDLLAASPWLGAYALRLMQNDHAKEALLGQALAGISLGDLREQGLIFAAERIPSMVRPDTMSRLREHQERGHLCVLVSASLDVYLEPWCQKNGFDFCLTSSLATDEDGRASGKLMGANCFGEEKVRRIKNLLENLGTMPPYVYAYGDSKGDIPMLNLANEGFFVRRDIQPFIKNS